MFNDTIKKVVTLTAEETANLVDRMNRKDAHYRVYRLAAEEFDNELEIVAAIHGTRRDGICALHFGDGCIVVTGP